ncbi:MAG TPA: ComEA family DNA-binding protein [Solirubrobacterales bacterium]|nr:ComEA family DNA-binding protein [Solirubrobacterales bacterium]
MLGAMGSLSRSQLLVYGAVAVTLLLVGARWIRSADEAGSDAGSVSFASASDSSGSAAGSFGVETQGGEDVVVHVAGAVREPDVYRLPAGSRVNDAVERAGGPTAQAELEGLNLAARLTDGQQVVMPAKVAGGGAATGSSAASTPSGPISLGTASVEELDTIEGIGPVTAQKIIDFRAQEGGVSSVDQLDQIDGIGPATMDALRSRLQP